MKQINALRLQQAVETRFEQDRKNGVLHGMMAVVNQNGKRVYTGALGVDGSAGKPLTEKTLYRIASMTKPITAVAALREMDLGHLALEDPVSKYLPGYAELWLGTVQNGEILRTAPTKGPVLIRHLLSHASGIGSDELGGYEHQQMPHELNETLAGTVDYFAGQPVAFEPGTACSYSATAAFDVMARIVEVTSGELFADYLKQHIFAPLQMTDTTFAPTAEQWSRVVTMHDRTPEGVAIDGSVIPGCVFEGMPVAHTTGGAGLVTTIEEYSRFAEMLLNGGKTPEGNVILSSAAVAQMATPQVPAEQMPGRERWGLSVRVITTDDYTLPRGTFGWSGAYGNHYWVDPENRITAVFMKNSRYDGGAGNVTAENFERDVMNSLE